MIQYLIRFVKYVIYLGIILMAFLALIFYTSNHGELTHFWQLIHPSNYWQVALFLVAFAAIYPFFGFVQRKVHLNRSFDQDRDALIEVILQAKYQIESDLDQKIVFRPKSAITRLMRMYEDRIILDYSDNPIVLQGMRRDVFRFSRSMEYIVRQLLRE